MTFWLALLVNLLYVADKKQVVHVYDRDHRWLRSIATGHTEKPRGIAFDPSGATLFLSAGTEVIAVDVATERVRWRTPVEGSPADRLDVSADRVYVPSGFNSANSCLFVLSSADGRLLERSTQDIPSRAHNCLVLGRKLLLAGIGSHWMGEYTLDMHLVRRFLFSDNVRPFVVDAGVQHLYVNLDNLLGFEVLDLASGRIRRVEAPAVPSKHPPHHQCPSHGLALTPDGKELWVVDSAGDRLLFFDARTYELIGTLPVGTDPGWLNFSLDGVFGYPSSGEVIEVSTHEVVDRLVDGQGQLVASEKIVELRPGQIGKQYGIGY